MSMAAKMIVLKEIMRGKRSSRGPCGAIHERLPLGEPAEIKTVVMQPPHNGPVTCISYRKGGIILSGAQDGTIRVWDSTPRCASDAGINQGVAKVAYDPVCLYGLGGYKVWL